MTAKQQASDNEYLVDRNRRPGCHPHRLLANGPTKAIGRRKPYQTWRPGSHRRRPSTALSAARNPLLERIMQEYARIAVIARRNRRRPHAPSTDTFRSPTLATLRRPSCTAAISVVDLKARPTRLRVNCCTAKRLPSTDWPHSSAPCCPKRTLTPAAMMLPCAAMPRRNTSSSTCCALRNPLSTGQYQMLRAIDKQRRVAIASAHSVGKTHVDAIAALWWVWRFEEGVALITGPSDRQTKKVWNELTNLWNQSPTLRATIPAARLLDKELSVTPMRYIQRFTAQVSTVGGDREAPGGQGFHSAEGAMLAIIDEAEGISEAVVNALEGAMGGPDSRMVMTANPLLRFGPFYDVFSKDSWDCHQMSAFSSPNLEGVIRLDDLIARYEDDPDDPWFDENPRAGLTNKRLVIDRWNDMG